MTSQLWQTRLIELLSATRHKPVLLIGGSAGKTAALLCANVGERHVHVAVEDSIQAVRTRDELSELGVHPTLLVGDDELFDRAGYYDRVLILATSPKVEETWTRTVRPGGVMVAAIANPFGPTGVVRLVARDHWLVGPFVALAEEAELRTPSQNRCCVLDAHANAEGLGSPVGKGPPAEFWEEPDALFTAGLRLPGVRVAQPARRGSVRWIFDATSWCRIDTETAAAWAFGPRALIQEVVGAHQWWVDRGRPAYSSFGLTVASFGRFAWYENCHSGYLWAV